MEKSQLALVAGYVLAVPFTVFTPGFLRLWRRREPWVFAAAQVGAALIVGGWVARGGIGAAVGNGLWLLGLTVAYVLEGRKRTGLTRAGGTRAGSPADRQPS